MDRESQQLEAARAVSTILEEQGINHAIIGGYAVSLLGHDRHTIDVDVEIDVEVAKLDAVRQQACQKDARFTIEDRKLLFQLDASGDKIPIETLPIGMLGLPLQLRTLRTHSTLPVLHPGVLVLTKMKRCAHLCESTRPQSRLKFLADVSDIRFLLEWLKRNDENIDFVGYQAAKVDRLYQAAQDLVQHWRRTHQQDLVDLMGAVLQPSDREKVMEGQERESNQETA